MRLWHDSRHRNNTARIGVWLPIEPKSHNHTMFASVNTYLSAINRSWSGRDGELVASFLSLRDRHSNNPNLQILHPENLVERTCYPPIDEIVSAHLKVLYHLSRKHTNTCISPASQFTINVFNIFHSLAKNYMEAYRQQAICAQAVVKMLQHLKEVNWCLPIMHVVCLDLRLLAQKCEEVSSSVSKPGEILEKAAECLLGCFRVCASDSRASDEHTKRMGMLNLVNQLFKVYFRINKLHLCKPLIRAIESSVYKDYFPLAEQITYKYFVGRKAMFDSDYKTADEYLSFAFENCPRRFPKNKRFVVCEHTTRVVLIIIMEYFCDIILTD